jgi:hypothetical protein
VAEEEALSFKEIVNLRVNAASEMLVRNRSDETGGFEAVSCEAENLSREPSSIVFLKGKVSGNPVVAPSGPVTGKIFVIWSCWEEGKRFDRGTLAEFVMLVETVKTFEGVGEGVLEMDGEGREFLKSTVKAGKSMAHAKGSGPGICFHSIAQSKLHPAQPVDGILNCIRSGCQRAFCLRQFEV